MQKTIVKLTQPSLWKVLGVIVLGCVFIFSAASKLLVAAEFELYIYHIPAISWNWAVIGSRLIIGSEMTLGTLLILRVCPRRMLLTGLIILIIFSAYLIINPFYSDGENCFCFGTALPLSADQSLVKNGTLIVLTLLLIRWHPEPVHISSRLILLIAGIALIAPSAIRPPDFMLRGWYLKDDALPEKISHEFFDQALVHADSMNYAYKENVLLCFLSPSCKYCKWTAQRISNFKQKHNPDLPIVFVFNGRHRHVDEFWEASGSDPFPYYISPASQFFKYAGKGVPTLFLIENGRVIRNYGYRSFDGAEVLRILSQ